MIAIDNRGEQKTLSLKGFKLLAEAGTVGTSRVSETRNEYRLIAAVAMRLSGEYDDVVYTFDSGGNQIRSSLKTPVSYEPPVGELVMVSGAMLYYSRADSDALTVSSDSEGEDGLEDTDDKNFRQMLEELDPGASTGLTPLSREAEQRLPKNIGPALKAAKEKFFQ